MIAALFVADDGHYIGIEGVDAWTQDRDARKYAGPWPVVAHPPCARWGRYWFGGPSCKVRKPLGSDQGCFASALMSVRNFGGVIEHPAHSSAWEHFNLPVPSSSGGWTAPDRFGGSSCHVEQGHYGHRARKATWLYFVPKGSALPELIWGPSQGVRIDEGFHSNEERARARARCGNHAGQADQSPRTDRYADSVPKSARAARAASAVGMKAFEQLSKRERSHTPVGFRDLLLRIARRI